MTKVKKKITRNWSRQVGKKNNIHTFGLLAVAVASSMKAEEKTLISLSLYLSLSAELKPHTNLRKKKKG